METMTKERLVEHIETGHAAFKVLLAEIPPERILQAGVAGEWSVKDIVAHIEAHEHRTIDWVQARLRGEQPAGQPYDTPEEELTEINARIFVANRDRTLPDVLAGLDAAHERTLAFVMSTGERDLVDASRCALRGGEALWFAVAANTFWHYEEHARDIRAWL